LVQLTGVQEKIVSSNVETIVLRIDDKLSKISSFPGKAKTYAALNCLIHAPVL